jgi:hypothetical protein
LAAGATLNGGIFLAAAVVDRALKGSMAGERMNKSFGREVRDFKGRDPFFSSEFYRSTTQTLSSQQVDCNGKRLSKKGLRGRPGGQVATKNSRIFPKFPCKSFNSLLPLISKFGKKILK